MVDIANGGTLFLDEITEMPLHSQAKLLRFLEDRTFYRLGALKPTKADVRIIAATNRNPMQAINEGSLRKDLFFRLSAGYIFLSPLRKRKKDILPLAQVHMMRIARKYNKRFTRLSPETVKVLMTYHWPGNVRELLRCVEQAILFWDDNELKPSHLMDSVRNKTNSEFEVFDGQSPLLNVNEFELPPEGFDLEKFIENIIASAITMHDGNKAKTARYLKISRSKLYSHLKSSKDSNKQQSDEFEE